MPSPISSKKYVAQLSQAKNSDMHIDTISIMNSWKHKLPLEFVDTENQLVGLFGLHFEYLRKAIGIFVVSSVLCFCS